MALAAPGRVRQGWQYRNGLPRCQPQVMGKVDGLLAWLVPRRCVLCNALSGGRPVCDPCTADLPWLPMPGTPATVFAPLAYEYPVDRLVLGAKFHHRLDQAHALGELLAAALAARLAGPATTGRPDVLLPVPLHPRRLAERGYNQALELARPVAGQLGLRLAPRLALRRRPTLAQSGLSRAARRRNLRDAFVARDCAGLHVAVLDDVITTGSTVAALARALRRAGAAQVDVWAVARAL